MFSAVAILLALAGQAPDAPPQINPYPRVILGQEKVFGWEFDRDAEGWRAVHHCDVSSQEGLLRVRSTGEDPYLHGSLNVPGGDLAFQMRARGRTEGSGQIFWTTDRSPAWAEEQSARLSLTHDDQWHEYCVAFSAAGRLRGLRLDPGSGPGAFEIDWIRLVRQVPHPLEIVAVRSDQRQACFDVRNHSTDLIEFQAFGRTYQAAGQATTVVEQAAQARGAAGRGAVEAVTIEVAASAKGASLPVLRRTVFVCHPESGEKWLARRMGDSVLEVAEDGSATRIRRGEQLVGLVAPLVLCDGQMPALKLVRETPSIRFEGEGVTLEISSQGQEVRFSVIGQKPCEGPVVRVLGTLEQGLLAGLEYLGKGETSSSRLDIETSDHLRFAPDPMKVTMPLMTFVTDRGTMALTWTDMQLQPVYATPNFFDGASDHRMALRGRKIEASLLALPRTPVEETIYCAVKKQGLPPLPPAPRTANDQKALCLKALDGPLKTEAGWGHCAEDSWARHPFADHASTVWRLTGEVPQFPRFVPGGAHVPNGTIYFVTGRAAEWKKWQDGQAKGLIAQQNPDGSYHYKGRYARGHFENTANGICAPPAARLLEYAYVTGDRQALAAGCRTLEYMKRFDVPRGAQTWELALHTPDQLASAYLVWAYVRGYELTGKKEYLAEARRWALSGIPFTYLWSCRPVMLYGTVPVFGATDWRGLWIGLPVQWVGGVYAYALCMLAPHDSSLDWKHLARGILISAQQQQYPDGRWVGLLPDSFNLPNQTRNAPRINPCAVVSLEMVLDGQVDFLSVAAAGGHRVAAPFPVAIRDGKAHVRGRAGLNYQVLVDGRIVDVACKGEDVVPLGP